MERDEGKLDGLIRRCVRGERSAWEEFYATYQPLVARVVRRYCSGDRQEAEDATQEVFIGLFTALKSYDFSRPIEAYIVEIARRVRISRYRKASAVKRGGLARVMSSLDGPEFNAGGYISVVAAQGDQETDLARAQDVALMRRAMDGMTEICRQLLAMRYDQDLSYREMAEALGDAEGTLRVRVQRCLSSLSKKLEDPAFQGVR